MRARGPAKSGVGVRLATVLLMSATAACLFDPPIVEPPVEIDTPPFVDVDDVSPLSQDLVIIDRSVQTTKVLAVLEVSDYNLGDELTYEFWALTGPLGRLQLVAPTRLRESPVQLNPKLTTYLGASYTLDACAVELMNEDWMVVWLRLTDEIPPQQRETLGRSEYVLDFFWDIQLLNGEACPSTP